MQFLAELLVARVEGLVLLLQRLELLGLGLDLLLEGLTVGRQFVYVELVLLKLLLGAD